MTLAKTYQPLGSGCPLQSFGDFAKSPKGFPLLSLTRFAKNKLCQSLEPFEIKENQQNPPKSTSDKIAEQSAFANLKNISTMIKETFAYFAFKASAFKTILKIILTNQNFQFLKNSQNRLKSVKLSLSKPFHHNIRAD